MDRICKNCKFFIAHRHSPEDIQAQQKGFCSDVCLKLYREEKELILKKAMEN